MPAAPWEWCWAGEDLPQVLLVNGSVGVTTDLLKILDTRMLRNPFAWDAHAQEDLGGNVSRVVPRS